MTISIEQIAAVCHDANRRLCLALGDHSQVYWPAAPKHIQDSAIAGVVFAVQNPEAGPGDQHDAWMQHKEADGWRWGPTKNESTKEHPCMVAFDQLPQAQQSKDVMFKCIVLALAPLLDLANVEATLAPAPATSTERIFAAIGQEAGAQNSGDSSFNQGVAT